MKNQSINTKWDEYQQIIHHLMIKAPFIRNLGLLKGKMGIVILFYELSKRKEQKIYADYAGELLDIVIEELRNESLIDFESGLSGIVWGIEYLIQNKYIEGNSLEICDDINKKITKVDPKRIYDISLGKGLLGLLHYVLIHINGCLKQNSSIPFDNTYLIDLYENIKALLKTTEDEDFIFIAKAYRSYIEKGCFSYIPRIKDFSKKINHFDIVSIDDYSTGISEGLASLILIQLHI